MTITKTALIDMIGFDLDGKGDLAVRIAKCTWFEGALVERAPHKFLLEPGDDIDAQMLAVNEHLMQMGFSPVPAEDVTGLKAEAQRRWTPDRVKARRAKVEKARVEADAAQRAEEERLATVKAEQAKAEQDRIDAEVKRIAALVDEALQTRAKQ